ncbi:ABC transporter ATP-binding protein [Flavobacterium sp. NRK1]|uniref:ABC transporter ATP-binding protein n=1 Tax=Flavobacterium sp. NRK1 TaxID=2954929 RepID=UPI0021124E4B|nr:ATP-binding cassette domain-containing protein [Flavobacterium sp. NRK1]
MIEFNAVSKSFGYSLAVKNISMTVEEGETMVLLGTSGCGKTTTLKMINRLIEPDSGEILIVGKNIANQRPEALRKNIGFLMQNIGLFPHYTVAENIAVGPKLLGWDTNKIKQRTGELIDKLHLSEDNLVLYPHELSGGQQQRVGLARALMTDTSILLMDEPFGALDNITRSSIHAEFKELDELKRKTIIMVTHDVQEAFELGDRICLMDKGEIVQIGAPKELLYKPVNDFAKGFLENFRLTLEFKTVTLGDIKSYLPRDTAYMKQMRLSEDTSVWDTLQRFSNEKMATKERGAFEEITNAFHKYQQSQGYE